MIIGRAPAPSGAIKIKRNEEGVPRVVSCGCCGCGCNSVSVSGELLETLRGISSAAGITCNGVPPDNFDIIDKGFTASWSDYENHGVPNTGIMFSNACLTLESFLFNSLALGAPQIPGPDGAPISCCIFQGAIPCFEGDEGDIVINGTSFPSYKEIFLEGSPTVSLNLVFS